MIDNERNVYVAGVTRGLPQSFTFYQIALSGLFSLSTSVSSSAPPPISKHMSDYLKRSLVSGFGLEFVYRPNYEVICMAQKWVNCLLPVIDEVFGMG